MFATAPATARRPRSSRGREMMRTTRPPVVDGLSLTLQAASSDTSTSTTATIQASYAIAPDFFNGLLVEDFTACPSFYRQISLISCHSKSGRGTCMTNDMWNARHFGAHDKPRCANCGNRTFLARRSPASDYALH